MIIGKCSICGKFDSGGPDCMDLCTSCWCIHNPYFGALAIKFASAEAVPKEYTEDYVFIKERNAFLYEGWLPFGTSENFEVRSVAIGCLGGLTDQELTRVFDHVWAAGKKE